MNSLLADPFISAMSGDNGPVGGSPLNVYEQDDKLIVEAEMPGFDPDDIEVSIERGMLTVRGEMEDEDERQDRNYLVREYRRGTFVRSVRLPDTVDTEKVQAEFENGVLKLIFPKAEGARPRRISVGEGSTSNGSGRRRRSNGHEGNSQSQSGGMSATEAQQADARAGRQSQESSSSGTGSQGSGSQSGSHTGQSATSGSSTGSQTGERASSGSVTNR
jgi:HSP20 family protein